MDHQRSRSRTLGPGATSTYRTPSEDNVRRMEGSLQTQNQLDKEILPKLKQAEEEIAGLKTLITPLRDTLGTMFELAETKQKQTEQELQVAKDQLSTLAAQKEALETERNEIRNRLEQCQRSFLGHCGVQHQQLDKPGLEKVTDSLLTLWHVERDMIQSHAIEWIQTFTREPSNKDECVSETNFAAESLASELLSGTIAGPGGFNYGILVKLFKALARGNFKNASILGFVEGALVMLFAHQHLDEDHLFWTFQVLDFLSVLANKGTHFDKMCTIADTFRGYVRLSGSLNARASLLYSDKDLDCGQQVTISIRDCLFEEAQKVRRWMLDNERFLVADTCGFLVFDGLKNHIAVGKDHVVMEVLASGQRRLVVKDYPSPGETFISKTKLHKADFKSLQASASKMKQRPSEWVRSRGEHEQRRDEQGREEHDKDAHGKDAHESGEHERGIHAQGDRESALTHGNEGDRCEGYDYESDEHERGEHAKDDHESDQGDRCEGNDYENDEGYGYEGDDYQGDDYQGDDYQGDDYQDDDYQGDEY